MQVFFETLFLPEFLSNEHEIWTQYSQSSQDFAMIFLSYSSFLSGFILDSLDHYVDQCWFDGLHAG